MLPLRRIIVLLFSFIWIILISPLVGLCLIDLLVQLIVKGKANPMPGFNEWYFSTAFKPVESLTKWAGWKVSE